MVIWEFLRLSTFLASMSTQHTSLPDSAKQVPVTRPTYPVPMTAIFMRCEPHFPMPLAAKRVAASGRSRLFPPKGQGVAQRFIQGIARRPAGFLAQLGRVHAHAGDLGAAHQRRAL